MTYSDKFKISNNSQFVLPPLPELRHVTLLGEAQKTQNSTSIDQHQQTQTQTQTA